MAGASESPAEEDGREEPLKEAEFAGRHDIRFDILK
jgi:hypothetical protein